MDSYSISSRYRNNLQFLEREDAAITAEEERKAEAALERLRSIAPRIKRPSEG